MVNWIPIVSATLAAIPAAAIFFVAYGRYDGMFQDRTVFLYFIGGLFAGVAMGFFGVYLLASPTLPLVQVIGLSLLLPLTTVVVINRRKWQGERHAIFNGGAAGLGLAVMFGFTALYYRIGAPYRADQAAANEAALAANVTAPVLSTAEYAFSWTPAAQGFLLAIALAGLFFGMGLVAGNGVRLRKQFRVAFLGLAIFLAPVVFLEEFFRSGAWLWAVLLAAYGAIFAVAAERKLLIEGVTEEARKQRRRRRRAQTE